MTGRFGRWYNRGCGRPARTGGTDAPAPRPRLARPRSGRRDHAPPADDSPARPPAAARPTLEQLADALVTLEDQFPPPDKDEILADARWIQSRWGTAVFAPYRGTNVAVLNGQIVGNSNHPLQMKLDLTRKYGVHPQRFVIVYIDPPVTELVYPRGAL